MPPCEPDGEAGSLAFPASEFPRPRGPVPTS
ncbi:hypothetical protein J2853_004534 [Streptosporangium lutulentum]|uniref:Uncharacterized protein n=1 Tax=Streptosporangium lutulentum TaxID=1461250 RepID=A0ABT9QEZ7_9ACTN|nr:hypothetical protein [Streptosporangium lutulentum]